MMKIKELLLGGLLLNAAGAFAANNAMSVANIEVPQGGSVELAIALNNETANLSGWQCDLGFSSDGLTLTLNAGGTPEVTLSERVNTTHSIKSRILSNGNYRFVVTPGEGEAIPGSSGALFSVTLKADASLEVGQTYEGTLCGIEFYTNDETPQTILMDDVTFTVTIGEPGDGRTVLDENSETVPASATNVDVRVKRTINANQWSTIVLPFAMTEEQVKEAFGNDVQLADFIGTDPEFDGENVVAVTANFTTVQAIEANHPYIIKVSSPISEFTLDGVDIVANEDEAYIEFDNGKTGSRREVYSGFYGTYHAQTVLDEFTLFLSDNKFWYSTGLTKMKAFRAYFDFLDILTEVENGSANVKMFVNTDNDATGIHSLNADLNSNETIYNLAGQRVGKNYKGIVIENGKKIMK